MLAASAEYASCGALGGQQHFQIQGENGTMHFDGGEALEEALWSFAPGIPIAVTISDFPSGVDGCSDFQVCAPLLPTLHYIPVFFQRQARTKQYIWPAYSGNNRADRVEMRTAAATGDVQAGLAQGASLEKIKTWGMLAPAALPHL